MQQRPNTSFSSMPLSSPSPGGFMNPLHDPRTRPAGPMQPGMGMQPRPLPAMQQPPGGGDLFTQLLGGSGIHNNGQLPGMNAPGPFGQPPPPMFGGGQPGQFPGQGQGGQHQMAGQMGGQFSGQMQQQMQQFMQHPIFQQLMPLLMQLMGGMGGGGSMQQSGQGQVPFGGRLPAQQMQPSLQDSLRGPQTQF